MKKKILLILLMFVFMTNAKALSFDTSITNIEDKGNNGTIGSIEKIDLPNKTLNVFFQDIGDEVSFDLTITNSGDRAGTLRSIDVTSTNDKIEYTNNLPEGGLAINGDDFNTVTITAKVKEGAVNGTSSSEIKITYNYDEGSCPDGEILSKDESMCLCPEGLSRNEKGVCIKPEKEVIVCNSDEVYNETKKICEKKSSLIPDKTINPSNPKTMDNIILVTLLFMVSGLGIYAVLFKKLKTNKKKITVGALIGVLTLGLSFTVLASVFGIDNLLSAIVNPITKKQELVVTVNEEIELIETWDGVCDLDVSELTPENIFEGGSGTPSDPYQIKTAEQLGCFAVSVNNGSTYKNQYIKQTKNIKLNDKVLENVENNTIGTLNNWVPIGRAGLVNDTRTILSSFNGTYNGNNHVISGMYINNAQEDYLGLFGVLSGGTIMNLNLSDNYINGHEYIGTLAALTDPGSTIENVKTYGILNGNKNVGGIISDSNYTDTVTSYARIINSENHSNITANNYAAGIGLRFVIIIDSKNYGEVTSVQNASGIAYYSCYIINSENHGDISGELNIVGLGNSSTYSFGSDNYGKITGKTIDGSVSYPSFYIGIVSSGQAYDCNNYGDIESTIGSYPVGIAVNGARVYNAGNTGTITAHDFTYDSQVYVSPMLACGANMISDENLNSESAIQVYHDIMNKDFVSRNTNSYNTGDVYVSDITATSVGVTMMGNSGVGTVYNAHNTGSMYVSNLTTTQYGGTFTMMATDGGTYTNVSSVGDMTIDNLNSSNTVYVVGVATSGSTVRNGKHEGNIEIKNSTIGGSTYNEQWDYYSYNYLSLSGGTTSGGYMENSYTTGEMKIHDNNFPAGAWIGSLTASGAAATRSYSTMSIDVNNNIGDDSNSSTLKVAALATDGGMGVTDSYNRGNISVTDNSFVTLKVGNRTGGMSFSGGNYNSGNYYVKDNYATTMQLGGYDSGPFFSNFYNFGDITFETENNTKLTTLDVAGVNIMSFNNYHDLVNSGNITIPYVPSITHLAVGGVFTDLGPYPASTNIYNLGTITIEDGYTYSNDINYGNIYSKQSTTYDPTGVTPSAYYTSDGYAMGLSRTDSNYRALDANYGTKINASQAPNILSIINVNDVYNTELDEDGLPTLKVFNE